MAGAGAAIFGRAISAQAAPLPSLPADGARSGTGGGNLLALVRSGRAGVEPFRAVLLLLVGRPGDARRAPAAWDAALPTGQPVLVVSFNSDGARGIDTYTVPVTWPVSTTTAATRPCTSRLPRRCPLLDVEAVRGLPAPMPHIGLGLDRAAHRHARCNTVALAVAGLMVGPPRPTCSWSYACPSR